LLLYVSDSGYFTFSSTKSMLSLANQLKAI
jgi:hypothetical protein